MVSLLRAAEQRSRQFVYDDIFVLLIARCNRDADVHSTRNAKHFISEDIYSLFEKTCEF